MKTDRGVWVSGMGAGTPLQLSRAEPETGSTNQKQETSRRMPPAMVQSVLLLSLLFCSGMKVLSSFPKEGTVILITAEVAAHQRR